MHYWDPRVVTFSFSVRTSQSGFVFINYCWIGLIRINRYVTGNTWLDSVTIRLMITFCQECDNHNTNTEDHILSTVVTDVKTPTNNEYNHNDNTISSDDNDIIVHVDHFQSITLWRKSIEIVLYRAKDGKPTRNSIFSFKIHTSTYARFGMNNVRHSLC